ncbi:MAG TPA: endonuclease III [Lachnospiraceae bacterium]|jgi:endonuclease-3|nr:endonuclease III [Lachnospiraceae bacterium]
MTEETREILDRLAKAYPDAACELEFEDPLQLITATVLSAQTTDRQVNKVTRVLFADYPDLDSLLTLSQDQIRDYIHTVGFFNTKAEHLYYMWRQIKEEFGGQVPHTMEELTRLPGVGRKTANVVLANAFGIPALAVDTHVFRVSNRLGLAHAKTAEETEKQLKEAIDKDRWSLSHHLLIFHGRRCCKARKPMCEACPVKDLCQFYGEASPKKEEGQ